jgi:nitrogen fixation protein FixH
MSATVMESPATTPTSPDRKPRGSRIPLIFFAFFGVVLIANSTLIYIALSTWTGLETKNHYIKGRDYNDTLAKVAAQDALGWTVESAVLPTGTAGRFAVSVRVVGADGAPVEGATVVARLERPTHHGVDVKIALAETTPGTHVGVVDLPLAGEWRIRRLIWVGDTTHQTLERFHLPPEMFQ